MQILSFVSLNLISTHSTHVSGTLYLVILRRWLLGLERQRMEQNVKRTRWACRDIRELKHARF